MLTPKKLTSDILFRMLLYGDTGTGKTSLAASAAIVPALSPAVFLNFDDGLASVAHVSNVWELSLKASEIMQVVTELNKPRSQRSGVFAEAKTLVVDSLSALRDDVLIDVTSAREDVTIPRLQDYGAVNYKLTAFMNALTQTDYHLIVIAGENVEPGPDGGAASVKPLLMPRLQQTVGHMMSYVWYTKILAGEYRLLTLPRPPYQIKTRNPHYVRRLAAESRKNIKARWKGVPEAELEMKLNAGEGWFTLAMTDAGVVNPGIGYFYDLYISSIKE